MPVSDNDPLEGSHQPPRPLVAARNAALSRVDLPIAPPPCEENLPRSSSTAGEAGEASGRGVARGDDSSMPSDLVETGYDAGGGSCAARSGGVSSATNRATPTHQRAVSGGDGGGGRGRGGGAQESGRVGESSSPFKLTREELCFLFGLTISLACRNKLPALLASCTVSPTNA